MQKVEGTTITMTRGDTLLLQVEITQNEEEIYTPQAGDRVRFALKKTVNDYNPILVKNIPIETLILRLDPADTKRLAFGNYVYDIELTFANGFVDTIIDDSSFVLAPEVY